MTEEQPEDIPWKEFIDIPGLVSMIVIDVILGIFWFTLKVQPLYLPAGDVLSDFPFLGKDTLSEGAVIGIYFSLTIVLVVGGYHLAKHFPAWFHLFNPFSAMWFFLGSAGLVILCTEFFKNYVGRPRPDLYGRCGFNTSFDDCKAQIGKDANDFFKSWPSGHSSMAMCGSTFLTMFTQKWLHKRELWAAAATSLFIFLGFFVGSTRIREFRHHPDDVLAGFFAGFVITYVMWNRMYKKIFALGSGKPAASTPIP
jgi:phosphatidate phosphatase